jgi:DNA-binding GntR family transcriptional regulator
MNNHWIQPETEGGLPKPLAHVLADRIRQNIILGRYGPGSVLREQQLEKEFGSSRGPIRESLRMLLGNGLVVHEPRKGFRVRCYTEKEIRDIYKLRATLEGHIVEELRTKDVEPLLVLLDDSIERMQHHFDGGALNAYFEENILFHKLILDYTGNLPLTAVLHYLNELSLPLRYRLLSIDFTSGRSLNHHSRIVESLRDRDFDRCHELTRSEILKNVDVVACIPLSLQEQTAQ